MNTKLLHIQPRELQFIFELKKQSSCTIQLANNTHHHVAYKVKTTSPKKYCVRPNVGIIMPQSTCEFSVIMQAQRTAPPDMVCRDKFLIQSTIVPSGTTEEDITPSMFSKDGGKYIEEDKLKVALISPSNSPILSPINGASREGIVHEAVKLKDQSGPLRDGLATLETSQLKDQNGASKEVLPSEVSTLRDQNGPSQERVPPEASRLEDKTVALKGGLPHEAFKLRNQNTVSREEVMLHENLSLKDHNQTLKEELSHETLKPRDQNGALKEGLQHESKLNDQNGALKEELTHEIRDQNGALEGLVHRISHLNAQSFGGFDIHPPQYIVPKHVDESQELNQDVSVLAKIAEMKQAAELEQKTVKEVDRLKLVKDIDEMKLKLNEIELKVGEAQVTISMLSEERRSSVHEIKILKDKLMELGGGGRRNAQAGFPPLFICMVALICIVLGYLLRH